MGDLHEVVESLIAKGKSAAFAWKHAVKTYADRLAGRGDGIEDGEKPAENSYCEGYYIRNNNKKLRTLTVYPDAPIRMTVLGESKSVDLEAFLREVGNGSVLRFDIDANRIMKLEHVYLP